MKKLTEQVNKIKNVVIVKIIYCFANVDWNMSIL